MDLIPRELASCKSGENTLHRIQSSICLAAMFLLLQHCPYRKQFHAADLSAFLYTVRIRDLTAQHLIASADPENGNFSRCPFYRCLQSVLPHPFQISHGIFTAGEKYQIRRSQLSYIRHIPDTDLRHLLKHIKIRKI